MKILKKDNLNKIFSELASGADLLVPIAKDGVVNFGLWDEGAEVDLDILNSQLPPKDILFPQSENIFKFKREDGSLKLQESELVADTVVFGIRPCDMESIDLLDRVFLAEPVDTMYKDRRDKTIFVAHGCSNPDETCFCTSFAIQPGETPMADVIMNDVEDSYFLKAQTEKGEELIKAIEKSLEDISEEPAAIKAQKEAAAASQTQELNLDGVSKKLDDMFDSEIWENHYRRCLGCGTCTYLCPTCHCFDVQDEGSQDEGARYRCWDSCMYSDFTLMGHGHNPRPTRKERVRNRFMHKLNYYPNRNEGKYGCVGCGRCVRKCPVMIDITQVIQEVGGVQDV